MGVHVRNAQGLHTARIKRGLRHHEEGAQQKFWHPDIAAYSLPPRAQIGVGGLAQPVQLGCKDGRRVGRVPVHALDNGLGFGMAHRFVFSNQRKDLDL